MTLGDVPEMLTIFLLTSNILTQGGDTYLQVLRDVVKQSLRRHAYQYACVVSPPLL